jgi:hypothetical protein
MAEQFTGQTSTVSDSDSLIAGKDFTFYWKASRLFVILLLVLEIIVVVSNRIPFGTWIAVALVAVLFTWWLLQRFKVGFIAALVANTLVGVLTGILMAVFEIIWFHRWWYALNLIRRPVMLSVAAVIVAAIFYITFQSILKKNKIKESKGGGIYGGTKT